MALSTPLSSSLLQFVTLITNCQITLVWPLKLSEIWFLDIDSMFFKTRHCKGHKHNCHSEMHHCHRGFHHCLALLLRQFIFILLAHIFPLQIEPGADYTGLQYYLCASLWQPVFGGRWHLHLRCAMTHDSIFERLLVSTTIAAQAMPSTSSEQHRTRFCSLCKGIFTFCSGIKNSMVS